MYCPWTGLGNYGGFRGNRWLKNRIKIFKQFVIPSLQNQTNKNFTLWCSWRHEEKINPYVKELIEYLAGIKEFKTVHTFHGICFWDDKYSDLEARNRLLTSLHGSIGELLDTIGEVDFIYMTIQPSDDVYHKNAVLGIQKIFAETDLQAVGFSKGYMMNYLTGEVANYDPTTNPPFFTIKFPRDTFCDPLKHADYTSLKIDKGQYKAGTPCPSHEYIGDCLKYNTINERGFIVGCHFDNISTHFNIPFKGEEFNKLESENILRDFGLEKVEKLVVPFSLGKYIFNKLPHGFKRKIRYLAGEKRWILRPFFAIIYDMLRK